MIGFGLDITFLNKNIFKRNNPQINMLDKRGQGLSTNAIIMIVLGVVVLIVLVLGFTIGWGKFLPFLSTNNVDTIKNSCAVACSTNSAFDYCSVDREVKDGTNDKFKDNCYNLALEDHPDYASRNYGIDECPSIDCS